MSTEPEREIEKQLKAYASKRREQAGAPAELHPATRRLLQGEVARTRAKSGGASAPGRSFWTWRRQWAVGLAAACVVAALAIVLPSALNRKSRDESLMRLAKNDDAPRFSGAKTEAGKSEPMNKPAEALTGLPPAPAVTAPMLAESANAEAEKQKGVTTDTIAPAKAPQIAAKDSVGSNRELASSAANQTRSTFAASAAPPAPAPVVSDRSTLAGGAQAVSGTVTNVLTAQAGEPLTDRPGLDKSLSIVRRAQNVADLNGASAVALQFAADDSAKEGASLAKKKADTTVLNSFRLEQTGDQLRIVDNDGSVYTGFVESPGTIAGPPGGLGDRLDTTATDQEPTAKNAPAASAPASRAAVPQTRDFGAEFKQTTNGVFFRVNGTNVTLGKIVVFSGNLIAADAAPATNAALATTPSGGRGGAARASGLLTPTPPPGTQLRGTVIIDGTNQLQIKAHALKRTP